MQGGTPEVCQPKVPLTYRNIALYRVQPGATFNIPKWAGKGGVAYTLNVEAGAIFSTQPGGSILLTPRAPNTLRLSSVAGSPRRAAGFDAVLVIAFGGPQGTDDIRPFLANVLRGRNVPAERVDEVAHHYELFGGVSPITALTRRQAAGLAERLSRRRPAAAGLCRHAQLASVSRRHAGGRCRAPASAARLASSWRRRRAIRAASSIARTCRRARGPAAAGLADVEVTYVPAWYAHEGFIAANARTSARRSTGCRRSCVGGAG